MQQYINTHSILNTHCTNSSSHYNLIKSHLISMTEDGIKDLLRILIVAVGTPHRVLKGDLHIHSTKHMKGP